MGGVVNCRQALEVGLFSITPAIATAWENQPYTPITGTPYQRVHFIPNKPQNITMGRDHYRAHGILYIELNYPLNNGSVTAATRAEVIENKFKRGESFVNGGITVHIGDTPFTDKGRATDAFWVLPVTIYWYADINV